MMTNLLNLLRKTLLEELGYDRLASGVADLSGLLVGASVVESIRNLKRDM